MSMGPALKTSYALSNGLAPLNQQGDVDPKVMPVIYDFSASGAAQEFDYVAEQMAGIIGAVQTVYIDNTDNPNPFIFNFQGTGQRLVVPALCGGYFPIMTPGQLRGTVQTTAGVSVYVGYLNVPMPLQTFGPNTVNIANLSVSAAPIVKPTVDAGGVIAAGGTPQPLFGANLNRSAMCVSNPTNEAESLTIIFASGAQFELLPGESYISGQVVSGEAVTINAATTGHTYNAWEQ